MSLVAQQGASVLGLQALARGGSLALPVLATTALAMVLLGVRSSLPRSRGGSAGRRGLDALVLVCVVAFCALVVARFGRLG